MFYELKEKTNNGEILDFNCFKNKVVLIVNSSSKSLFEKQLISLQKLYDNFKNLDFEIICFPSGQFNKEFRYNEVISKYYKLNYNISFILGNKIKVNGKKSSSVFKFLKNEKKGLFGKSIKSDFTKFLIDKNGNVIKRYSPIKTYKTIEKDIMKLL
ncbi:MAG: glutathione peroxidase [Bacilli bacterium]